jgi:hypothetical protein
METKKCTKCNQSSSPIKQISMGLIGFYIIISSVYGSIQLIKEVVSFFQTLPLN